MKCFRLLTRTAVGLALAGLVVPEQLVRAAGPAAAVMTERLPAAPQAVPVAPAAPTIGDVALASGGVFAGQVVDAEGRPQADTVVAVFQQQQVVATVLADQQGQFSIRGLQGGMYQVTAGSKMTNYRLWAADTAPPTAQRSALLVSGQDVVRGQGSSRLRYWLTNPWVLAVGVATAIAVPIALSNRSKASSS
jgi:hypothetical protein